VVKKQDNLDQQTKDEKEYLGAELFEILQRSRVAAEAEQAEEEPNETEKNGHPKVHAVPKFGSTAKTINETVE